MKRCLTVVLLLLMGMAVAPLSARAKTPGVNGRIAYTAIDPQTGDPHVVTVNPDGSNPKELPLGVPAGNPRWSPDGTQLTVFTFTDAGFRPAVVPADGSSLKVLAVGALPAFVDISPCIWQSSGDRLLCAVRNFNTTDHSYDGIYSIAASDGGDPVRLTVNPYPPSGKFGGGDVPGDVSPDGSSFVFMRARQDQPQARGREQSAALFVEHTDGTGLRQITPYGLANSHDGGFEGWSPNGSKIVFGGEHGSLYTINPDGSSLASIPLRAGASWSNAFYPGWSPDGSRIVFGMVLGSTSQIDIYTERPDGSDLTRVTTDGLAPPDSSADWGQATL